MPNPSKDQVLFNMEGHFIRELKIVLDSKGLHEEIDYTDPGFSPIRRSAEQHLLVFNDLNAAARASSLWNEHIRLREKVRV